MLEYNKKIWKTNEVLATDALNNMENGIEAVTNELNNLPEWVKSVSKPSYSADEIGAATIQELQQHEISGTAHQLLFNMKANKNHTHSLDDINSLFNEELNTQKSSITAIKGSVTKLKNSLNELSDKIDALQTIIDSMENSNNG